MIAISGGIGESGEIGLGCIFGDRASSPSASLRVSGLRPSSKSARNSDSHCRGRRCHTSFYAASILS
jgi:hypothetical protein